MLSREWLFVVAGIAMLWGNASLAAIIDDFNDNSINSQLWVRYPNPRLIEAPNWVSFADNTGVDISETNQRVEILIPSDAFSPTRVFGASLHSRPKVHGDFDLQVDFKLLEWPNASGVRMGMALWDDVSGLHADVVRTSFGPSATDFPGWPRENYVGTMINPLNGFVAQGISSSSDQTGKLRFARVGDSLTSYFFGNGDWVVLSTATVSNTDMDFALAAWSTDYYFSRNDVRVAFDNMTGSGIVEVSAVPEPNSLALMGGLFATLSSGIWFRRHYAACAVDSGARSRSATR